MTPQAFPLGQYFAQLAGDDRCLPVEVDAAFWETGVSELPPGRLVSMFESASDWAVWECHPQGEEMIIQIEGELVLILEQDGVEVRVPLRAGEFAVVPKGIWHTADAPGPGRAIYITPGEGTQSRERL
ncbi:cupin domain-containing protein [Novosphingobium taihuense]|uniref:Mannose-6-phosphate isomerase-like protein (Cupin superfamily) n=1 Tax=Novosphingobium taihuense TaxID=260085 RepID=A0A7W7EV26_9SPHN|nr:cupin domain-containing protein [Novosphingobium taihuense]MBB4612845.1 mannose-6-phosphate isomerase-like protein (cupin superfamily) [Novosphingobium taihuense]TWH78490.1 Cupin domain-containing protein [Novosphingobium taihuense]